MQNNFLQTILSNIEEMSFRLWYSDIAKRWNLNSNPYDPRHYYDYRGAWKKGIKGPDETGHWPSEFKLPGHPTYYLKMKTGIDYST